MKTFNHLFSSNNDFDAFLNTNSIGKNEAMLIRIHSALRDSQAVNDIVSYISNSLPNAQITGCSTNAVIFNGRRITNACLVSISIADNCFIKSCTLPCFDGHDQISGEEIAVKLCRELELCNKKGQLFVFIPPKYYQCNAFANKLYELAPDIKIIGGVSCSNESSASGAFTISRCLSSEINLSAAAVSGDNLKCFENYAVGMEKLTDAVPIDSYKDNVISSVGGKDAYQWMSELFNNKITKKNDKTINIFPIYRKKLNGSAWNINFNYPDDTNNDIFITDTIQEGEYIGLGYISTNSVVDEVFSLYKRLEKVPAESVFVYSCALRSHMLQNCSTWELSPLMNTHASGAFLWGEFYFNGKRSLFGNYCLVISLLAEQETFLEMDTNYLLDTRGLYHDNEYLVNFLTKCASESINNRDTLYYHFQDSLYSDKKMKLGNLTKLFYDSQAMGINKLCMLSVRNSNELMAYAGYKAYDTMLKNTLKKIQKFFAELPMQYYYSEHGDYLIAANDDISSIQFEAKMQELYRFLTSIEYNRMLPLFEFSVVLNQKHLLRSAKVVQSVMHSRKGLRYLVYSIDMGMDETCIQDVRMVQIINEAISKNRVIPYYQGIYDNQKNNIEMYESLMRLTDASGNIYYPGSFLDISKKYGLYSSLSRQMIRNVMRNFKDRDVYVTINLSMQDLIESRTKEMIYEEMHRAKNPDKFIFEVVETEDISDYDILTSFAERIHEFGGKLALDDFGSGFSNLMHIIRMDFDFLKVDGSIVKKICDDESCRKLLEVIALWCRMQGKKVIAEFVENKQIFDLLCDYGVDFSQGYYFSRPEKLFSNYESETINT